MVNTAVVLAGGKGTRLGATLPKPLVPVDGEPILFRQFAELRDAGVTDVWVTTGHGADIVANAVGNGSRWGMRVQCISESTPLGTAGGVAALRGRLRAPFFVVYGDVLFHMDLARLAAAHAQADADATLVLHPNDHPYDSDLVEVDGTGSVRALHPRPRPPDGPDLRNLVSAALYVVSPRALDALAPDQPADFVRDLFPALLGRGGRLVGYETTEYLKDMGTPDRLARVEADWRSGAVAARHRSRPRPTAFLDRDGVINAEIGGVHRPDDLVLLPGAAHAVARLNRAGWLVAVVTNQPDVAKGFFTPPDLDAVHRRLERLLGEAGAYVDGLVVCPHHPQSGFAGEVPELKVACDCRKPGDGLIRQIAARLPVDLARSVLVGDSWRDVGAARAARIPAIGVGHGPWREAPDRLAPDLAGAVDALLAAGSAP